MYEELVTEAQDNGIEVIEMDFKGSLKGLYSENIIAINSKLKTSKEKSCVLAEELGHHYTSFGDILCTKDIRNIKQEKIARNWGYEKLVGIIDIINAYNNGVRDRCEMAEYINVTEDFLDASIQHYKEKYGTYYEIDNYLIILEPSLGIVKMF